MRAGTKCAAIAALLVAFACLMTAAATAQTLAAPTVTNFAPKSGPVGSKVTIVGTNLSGAGVTFNGAPASAVEVNKYGNSLEAWVPSNAEGLTVGSSVQITVTTPGGTAMPASTFMLTQGRSLGPHPIAKPRIASFAPMAGKPGTTVTIKGGGFGGALAVKFAGVSASYKVPTTAKIVATVPRNARTGKLTVRTGIGTGTSAGRFTVLSSQG